MANMKVCTYLIDTVYMSHIHIDCLILQGSKATYNYSELEEVLRKNSSGDLELGITQASEAIEKHERNAKFYLLRAKLSFKLVRVRILKCICIIYFFPSLLLNSFMEE